MASQWTKALAGAGLAAGLSGCLAIPSAVPEGGLGARVKGYQGEAARLRGLALEREVPAAEEAPEALRSMLDRELDKPENRLFLSDTERLLKQLTVLKEGDSLRAQYVRLLEQQVAAYYDLEKKRVAYVDRDVLPAGSTPARVPVLERFVYVHEYCHAVEDARFDLERLMKASLNELDGNLALTALTEGDAVLVGLDGLCDGYPVNSATPCGAAVVRLLARADLAPAMKEMVGVSPFLGGALLRPYVDGAAFCNRIRRDEGWAGIDRVFTSRLPASTAEILFPERRYLRPFTPASFELDPALFTSDERVGVTNCVGALGMALWFKEKELGRVREVPFLRGWLGDRIYLVDGAGAAPAQAVWLSYWEREGLAREFRKQAERRLREGGVKGPIRVRREGRLVAAVWSLDPAADAAACETRAALALRTRVQASPPSALASWWQDLPLPLRFPCHEGHGAGVELLGGWAVEARGGEHFFRASVAGGLLDAERTPDRHHAGLAWGLLRHLGDRRSEFTYWQVPLVAAWHRRGAGAAERYRWSLLGGLLAAGDERSARLLFIPVWERQK